MAVCNPKGGRTATPSLLAMLLMMIMILLNAYCCSVVVVGKSNTSVQCSGSRLDECLIDEDLELELGFLINPYVSRMLADHGPKSRPNSSNNKPAFNEPCGKSGDAGYSECIAKHKPNPHECLRKHIYGRC
ncbi:uncharacterized protein LOC121250638 [Juglans microcarpa x Juglans regia]|uniref:uncharacterized protein LOC121250638 n=1 Tax=Juglans microcarpa x Juglans regia TaxID=2249226 RepID=UPI001B7DBED9|nr:uncharacterized protein LOC121250638 [Juglans microcarpa x Juglans regia]